MLIQVDFSAICLTLTGGGTYIINPQLLVDISITSAEAEFEGELVEIRYVGDPAVPEGISVDNGVSILDARVVVSDPAEPGDTVFKREIADDVYEAITFGDLVLGDEVEVEGLLNLDGTIDAEKVEVEFVSP